MRDAAKLPMRKISEKPKVVFDLDHTLCVPVEGCDQGENKHQKYIDALPVDNVVARLRELHAQGFEIIIHTSRNMRTYDGDENLIREHTLPLIHDWLERHQIPYDEVVVAKPWCGFDGFYVDDRSIRPSELTRMSLEEIKQLLDLEKR